MKRKLLSTIILFSTATFVQNAFGQKPPINPIILNFHVISINTWHLNGTRDASLVDQWKCRDAFSPYNNAAISITYNDRVPFYATASVPKLSLANIMLNREDMRGSPVYSNSSAKAQVGNYSLYRIVFMTFQQDSGLVQLAFDSSSLACVLTTGYQPIPALSQL